MKTDKIFWGILLVFIGGIFLLENFGVIDFSWHYAWRFWPVILILIGVNILFSRSNSKVGLLATTLITIMALGVITYMGLQKRENTSRWNWSYSDDNDEFDNDSLNNTEISSTYIEDYDPKFKTAKLNIRGGASAFELRAGTDKLFEANLNQTKSRYYLKKTETDSSAVLDFNSKNKKGNYSFKNEEFDDVVMMLNTQPLWDVSLFFGAGKADFDLSNHKVKSIYLKGGAAEFNVKVGDLYNNVNLTAETGVAEVKIEVPESMGCQIKTSTGLSSKDFDGFVKKADGTYETSNYRSAAKKINIVLKGGLSDFNVNRY
ncbi:LiaI-LiaF-like domain-containing protein [Pedobacter cryophilus]|uniref:LiaI-LiaF-like transmembrane region domain-containing protein n=1 Tax=Pedobacter cryophilus TaxID=2571271 RepID=A0A4V5NXJ3_9SPHI|nr:DUF5668 domain-containing protein [Pedobacter cryophilus]TKB98743.1 hypothetical protein FA046_06395 [Pedobacter cryophilus]